MAQQPRRPSSIPEPDPTQRILRSPNFQTLVRERTRFSWTLSIITIVVYLGFIGLVAFAHGIMATPVGSGPLSLGIVLGLVVILFSFAMTGIYVARANSRFDELTRTIVEGVRR